MEHAEEITNSNPTRSILLPLREVMVEALKMKPPPREG